MLTSQHWIRLGQFRDPRIRRTLEALPQIIAASRQASTVKTYVAAYRRFEIWASDFREIPVFPTTDMGVTVYLLSLIQQGKNIASIQQFLFATGWLHSVAGYDNPTKTTMVGRRQTHRDGTCYTKRAVHSSYYTTNTPAAQRQSQDTSTTRKAVHGLYTHIIQCFSTM